MVALSALLSGMSTRGGFFALDLQIEQKIDFLQFLAKSRKFSQRKWKGKFPAYQSARTHTMLVLRVRSTFGVMKEAMRRSLTKGIESSAGIRHTQIGSNSLTQLAMTSCRVNPVRIPNTVHTHAMIFVALG